MHTFRIWKSILTISDDFLSDGSKSSGIVWIGTEKSYEAEYEYGSRYIGEELTQSKFYEL